MAASNKIKPHQTSLLIAGFATLAGFLIPLVRQVLLPVIYLNTHLHELSHALMAVATGARVEEILVHANGSGETPVAGGYILPIASAGYLGASVFGAAMIFFGRAEKSARATLITLACLLTFSMIAWVRGDGVGIASGFGWIAALAGMAFFLRGLPLVFCCQFLGLQQCLNSFQSLFVLVRISADTDMHSDAKILQTATLIPSVVWALGWSAFSLFLVYIALSKSWQPAKR